MIKILVLLTFSQFFSQVSEAWQILGPELLASGGAGAAAITALDSAFLNPASLGFVSGVHIGGLYQDGYWDRDHQQSTYSLALTDASSEVLVPASLRYSR